MLMIMGLFAGSIACLAAEFWSGGHSDAPAAIGIALCALGIILAGTLLVCNFQTFKWFDRDIARGFKLAVVADLPAGPNQHWIYEPKLVTDLPV